MRRATDRKSGGKAHGVADLSRLRGVGAEASVDLVVGRGPSVKVGCAVRGTATSGDHHAVAAVGASRTR